jgi:hypothetical protein
MDTDLLTTLLIAALASYRIARMFAYERGAFDCFQVLRDVVESNTEEGGWLRYGITCPLCLGFWFSVLFVVVPQWVALPFAVAGLQTILQKGDWMAKRYNESRDLSNEMQRRALDAQDYYNALHGGMN